MDPIILRDVEVIAINPKLKNYSVLVHVKTTPFQMHTPEVQGHIVERVHYATKYLLDEGFLPDPNEKGEVWACVATGVCHP